MGHYLLWYDYLYNELLLQVLLEPIVKNLFQYFVCMVQLVVFLSFHVVFLLFTFLFFLYFVLFYSKLGLK